MKKVRVIVCSIVVFLLIGAGIIGWSVLRQSNEGRTTTWVAEFTDENFESAVLEASAKRPILVDFSAEWCVPCRMLEPILAEVAQDLKGKAVIGRVDTDRNMIGRRLGVNRIPTMWVVRNGAIREQFQGVTAKETLIQALKDHGP
jgi:thioredoxin 1